MRNYLQTPSIFLPTQSPFRSRRLPDNSVYAIVVCSAASQHKHYCLSSVPLGSEKPHLWQSRLASEMKAIVQKDPDN